MHNKMQTHHPMTSDERIWNYDYCVNNSFQSKIINKEKCRVPIEVMNEKISCFLGVQKSIWRDSTACQSTATCKMKHVVVVF